MNNLLIAIAVFAITVVGALFAVPHFIDWNSYRGLFEQEARSVIGREVRVDGDVKLHLLPSPYFRLEKVRIADASASLTGHFFKADGLSIKISITPLFRGIVEAHEIEFQRPVLRLAPDAKGKWNWQSFAQALQEAGYMPANVSLTSLRIRDGVLALHGADGAEHTRLDGLDGELSAPSLQGPYSFRGDFGRAGARRQIRLATGVPEGDGTVPFKVSLRLPDTGASYLLDARVANLMGRTRIKGDLTARLPIPANPFRRDDAAAPAGLGAEAAGGPDAFDLKGAIEADAAGARLSGLSLTFDQGSRPQVVTGTVQAGWRDSLALDMKLSSRWLDLDRLAGGAEGLTPVDGLTRVAAWLRALLPADGRTQARLTVEQANLGGEAIGPVRLRLTQTAGTLEIEELNAGLPGSSRGDLTGSISGPTKTLAFKGRIGVRGASAARFLAWASAGKLPLAAKSDGAFDIRTEVVVDATGVAAPDVVARLAGTQLRGKVGYEWDKQPRLAVVLEGPKVDARGLIPKGTSLLDAFEGMAPFAGNGKGRGTTTASLDLRVKAGQLLTDARTYRDVSAAVQMKGGDLTQLKLRLSGDDGYHLELEGRVSDLASNPKGSLRGFVAGGTTAALAQLAELLGLPAAYRPKDARAQALVPLRLAGTMTLGQRTATAADLVLDGEANGAAVKIAARFDGGRGGWRSGRTDLTASVEAADAAKVAALVFGGSMPAAGVGAGAGRMLVRASGIPAEGLASLATIATGDLHLDFRGKLAVPEAGAKAEGDLEVRAANGTVLAALAGLAPRLNLDGVPVGARLRLALQEGTISIGKLALQLGKSRLSGRMTLSDADGGRRRIEADLHTDEVALAALLHPLLDRQLAVADAAETLLQGRANPWPAEPFNRTVLDAFEGRIRLAIKRLTVVDGIALDRAKLDVMLRPGKIEVTEITGAGLGGQFKASLGIEKAAAGAEVRGTLDFDVVLETFASGDPPRASGSMRGTLAFSGPGLGPRAVMAALRGKGSIRFGEATLGALWPGAVAAAADAALKAEAGKLVSTVREGLAAGLATGSLALENQAVAVEIADGRLRSKPLIVQTADGRTSGTARLDLQTLAVESQWRLEASAPGAGEAGKALPAVTVTYKGPVASLGALEPEIDAAALEQELSARRIERDMQELERLRKLDEERRLEEADRLRKQFERTPLVPRPPPALEVPPITPSGTPGPQPPPSPG